MVPEGEAQPDSPVQLVRLEVLEGHKDRLWILHGGVSARSLWISRGGRRARGGKRTEAGDGKTRRGGIESYRGDNRGVIIGGTCHNDKSGLGAWEGREKVVGVGNKKGVRRGGTCHNDKPGLGGPG